MANRPIRPELTRELRWLPVKNTEEVPAPPFALLRAVDVGTDGVLRVAKPDADSQAGLFVNGPWAIPAGTYGQAHRTFPAVVAYETGSGSTPAAGETWGSKAGSWKLHPDRGGFKILGGAGMGLVNVDLRELGSQTPVPPPAEAETFLACLVAKCYWYGTLGSEFCTEDPECNGGTPSQPKPRRYVQYSWIEVLDSGTEPGPPCPVTYEWGSRCGGPGCLPAYHVNNLDLPVWPLAASPTQPCCGNVTDPPAVPVQPHSVVRLRKSTASAVVKAAGPNSPASAADDAAAGTVAWFSPESAIGEDNVYADANLDPGETSHYLKLTGFGFSLPPLAKVLGIEVRYECSQDPSPQGGLGVRDAALFLVIGGAVTGSNRADPGTPWPGTDAVFTRGAPDDLWGLEAISGEQVNDAGFGVALSVTNDDVGLFHHALVDHVTVTVHYETGEYYLIDTPPWSDLFRRTGQIDQETGLEIAYLRYFDQNDGQWKDGEEVRFTQAG